MRAAPSREERLKPLPLDHGAPLDVHRQHPGARLQLVCGACAWTRSYDAQRIVEGLKTKRLGDAQTAVSAVASLVHWPCPRCRRMRWGSRLAVP